MKSSLSQTLLRNLRDLYPEWVDPNQVIVENDSDDLIIVRFRSPLADLKRDLRIEANSIEATLFLNDWHAHFELWSDSTDYATQLARLVRMADAILNDRTLILIVLSADRVAGSSTINMTSSTFISKTTRLEIDKYVAMLEGSAYHLFSWSGAFDESTASSRTS